MTSPDPLALAAVVAYLGWDPSVDVQNETVNLDGNGTPVVALPSLNVTGVSAVTVTDYWGTSYTAELVTAPVDVQWSPNGVLTWRSSQFCGVWPEGSQNVAVTYSAGYGGAWPEDLTAAINSISKRTSGALLGATSARMGSAAINFGQKVAAGDLTVVEQMVLDRYRLPRSA